MLARVHAASGGNKQFFDTGVEKLSPSRLVSVPCKISLTSAALGPTFYCTTVVSDFQSALSVLGKVIPQYVVYCRLTGNWQLGTLACAAAAHRHSVARRGLSLQFVWKYATAASEPPSLVICRGSHHKLSVEGFGLSASGGSVTSPRCQAAAVSIQSFLIIPRSFAATPGSLCWPCLGALLVV